MEVEEEIPEAELPSLIFEEGSYTLPELLESHLLPVVVQYDMEEQPLPFEEFNFDFSQPLLLYKKRNIQKVSAKSLCVQNGRYEDVGESLLIPEDYKGWFSVLPRVVGLSGIDHGVPHFSTVEELANSNSERFLIGGTKRLTGLQISDMSAGHLDHSERHLFPGDVLTREKIYYGETKKKTRLFRKPKYIIEKFLMCRDEMEKEVLLPFEQQGIFYQVSHTGGKAQKNVLQMSDIVARKMTPRLIKLVYGRFPITPCAFSGLMRAESSDIEMSVIACTLVNTKNVLLELPVTSAMTFRVALTNDSLRLNSCYRNAISVCAERANTYMRNIKVCVDFSEEEDVQESPDNFVTKRNRSNSFDIDAIQPRQSRENGNPIKKSYGSLKRPTAHKNIDMYANSVRELRLSESLSNNVNLRPARSLSTGHMSFCLGNSYLTVPMMNTAAKQKRNSGNNNSIHQTTTKTTVTHISSGDDCFEEDNDSEQIATVIQNSSLSGTTSNENVEVFPAPLPCTKVGSYINSSGKCTTSIETVELFSSSVPCTTGRSNINLSGKSKNETSNYDTAWSSFRPVTSAPIIAPPPLPCISSNVNMTEKVSYVNNTMSGGKQNKKGYEYAVPKLIDPSRSTSNTKESTCSILHNQRQIARRPSTFTFSEGCHGSPNKVMNVRSFSQQDDESDFEDDCPIYENIKTLMEAVSAKERILENTNESCEQTNTEEPHRHNIHDRSHVNEYPVSSSTSIFTGELRIIEDGDDPPVKNENSESYKSSSDVKHSNEISATTEIVESNTGDYDDIANYKYSWEENNDSSVVNIERESSDNLRSESEGLRHTDEAVSRSINELDDIMLKLNNECNIGNNSSDNVIHHFENPLQMHLRKPIEKDRQTISPQNSGNEEDIRFMSTETIVENLRLVGIKEATVQKLTDLNIDGSKLCEVLDGATTLTKCLEGVNLIDQQKISMFIRGWRPDMDYILP